MYQESHTCYVGVAYSQDGTPLLLGLYKPFEPNPKTGDLMADPALVGTHVAVPAADVNLAVPGHNVFVTDLPTMSAMVSHANAVAAGGHTTWEARRLHIAVEMA